MTQKAYHQFPLASETTYFTHSHLHEPLHFPLHYHEEVEMIYMVKGQMTVTAMETTYTLGPGDLLIIGSNHIHGYGGGLETGAETLFHMVIFKRSTLATVLKEAKHKQGLMPMLFNVHCFNVGDNQGFESLMTSMAGVEEANETERLLKQLGLFYQVIGTLIHKNPFETGDLVDEDHYKKRQALMARVNDYVEAHYTEGISLDQIAEALNYSSYYFSRLFSRYTGLTFKKYLLNYQMIMVKEDIVFTKMPITEVAYKHGFNSIKTFNRVFKNYFGDSPLAYRKHLT